MKKKFWLTALLAVALLCGAALADTYFCSNCAKTQNFEVQSETYINDDYHETVWICEICGDPYKMNADHYGGRRPARRKPCATVARENTATLRRTVSRPRPPANWPAPPPALRLRSITHSATTAAR